MCSMPAFTNLQGLLEDTDEEPFAGTEGGRKKGRGKGGVEEGTKGRKEGRAVAGEETTTQGRRGRHVRPAFCENLNTSRSATHSTRSNLVLHLVWNHLLPVVYPGAVYHVCINPKQQFLPLT